MKRPNPPPPPKKENVQPKILRVLPPTTRRPIRGSGFMPSTPKAHGFPPHLRGTTTKRPLKKVVHGHPRRGHTTPHRSWPAHRSTRRPAARRWTYPPRIYRTSTARPSSLSDRRHSISRWLAKFIAYYCRRQCVINPAYGGHLCRCDEPPMDYEEPPQEYSINELKGFWSLVMSAVVAERRGVKVTTQLS